MRSQTVTSAMFFIVALYDGLLVAGFLMAPTRIFQWCGITSPNHPGDVQFPILLLMMFALMYLRIALDPVRNRGLIPYGILLKVSYSGLVFRYWFTMGIPDMWKPFAVIDALTAVLFTWAYVSLGGREGIDRIQNPGKKFFSSPLGLVSTSPFRFRWAIT